MMVLLIILNLATLFHDPVEGKYKILPGSRVYLEGTTNVNKFKCDCGSDFETTVYRIKHIARNRMEFSNTILLMPIVYFDCKNRKMDRDLQKALKAEQYPQVRIDLENITVSDASLTSNDGTSWTHAKAEVSITLAGVTQRHEILVKGKKGPEFQYLFSGNKSMKMTDFNITPPEALFGMIKVNDQITFYFDLLLQLDHHPEQTQL